MLRRESDTVRNRWKVATMKIEATRRFQSLPELLKQADEEQRSIARKLTERCDELWAATQKQAVLVQHREQMVQRLLLRHYVQRRLYYALAKWIKAMGFKRLNQARKMHMAARQMKWSFLYRSWAAWNERLRLVHLQRRVITRIDKSRQFAALDRWVQYVADVQHAKSVAGLSLIHI